MTNPAGNAAGTSRITPTLNDCVIREEWTGATVGNRITGSVVDKDRDRVRQHWTTSTDGGATWTTAFDGVYRRHR